MSDVPSTLAEVLALPSVAWEERDQLPLDPGIYFAVLDAEHIAYIGKTEVTLRQRWTNHHRGYALVKYGDLRIHWLTASQILLRAEASAIKTLQPIFNNRPEFRVDVEIRDGRKTFSVLPFMEGQARTRIVGPRTA